MRSRFVMVTCQDHRSSLYFTCTDIMQQNYMQFESNLLSYAVDLSDGLQITETDSNFSENSQILDDSELLDPKQDNVAQQIMIWIKKNHCRVF